MNIGMRGIFYVKILAVIGEYLNNYGCSTPNPVSIRREYPRFRFRIGWRMQTLHPNNFCSAKVKRARKNEDTWCKVLGHYDATFDSTLRATNFSSRYSVLEK